MTNVYLHPDQLIAFHEATVTRNTAYSYAEEMEKAKTPFIIVEKNTNNKYNVIGGFKYLDGIRLLKKEIKLYCTVVEPFENEKKRLLATLQRCIVQREKIIYKELLIYNLVKEHKLHELEISTALGQDADKIRKYMYKQIIPHTYIHDAEKKGLKPFINAIYLANGFSSFEKRVLTELSLYLPDGIRFKKKHIAIYKRYRKKYSLYMDIGEAKEQVLKAIELDTVNEKYWASIPHPHNHFFSLNTLNKEAEPTH